MIRNFKNLNIWQRSRKFVKLIYENTSTFPAIEQFGLSSQLRRAACSIPSNIAEGCGRNTAKDLSRFLDMAIGSCCELETQLYLSFDLGYNNQQELDTLIDEIIQIRKMIIGYQSSL